MTKTQFVLEKLFSVYHKKKNWEILYYPTPNLYIIVSPGFVNFSSNYIV